LALVTLAGRVTLPLLVRPFLFPVPYPLFPIPCSLFPVPYSLFPVPYPLFPIPCSLLLTTDD
jgi:hypothetical protein